MHSNLRCRISWRVSNKVGVRAYGPHQRFILDTLEEMRGGAPRSNLPRPVRIRGQIRWTRRNFGVALQGLGFSHALA
jgi:hypothetical protein